LHWISGSRGTSGFAWSAEDLGGDGRCPLLHPYLYRAGKFDAYGMSTTQVAGPTRNPTFLLVNRRSRIPDDVGGLAVNGVV